MIGRREFIELFGGALMAWPFAAQAQQQAMPVVGFLSSTSAHEYEVFRIAFERGLVETGYVNGRNVTIEYRWAEGHYDQLPQLAAQFAYERVAVIATAGGSPAALAAKAATQTIPIVFSSGVDPVRVGLVASLSRPGGNVTGVYSLGAELISKRLEVLRELLPSVRAFGYLANPSNRNMEYAKREIEAAAGSIARDIIIFSASSEAEIDLSLQNMVDQKIGGLVVSSDAFLISSRDQVVKLAAHHAIPAIYDGREFVDAGGLMAYGGSLVASYRQIGIYTGRILKGEKPADLPVQQATKVELIINLKTAKALGLEVPMSLLMRVDEVIE